MPIISIANLTEKTVQSILLGHIQKIETLKLSEKSAPQDQSASSLDLGIRVDYSKKTIDTGNDDALSAQYGVEPLSKIIEKLNALIAAYYKKREAEHSLLGRVYKELIQLLGIPSHKIVLSKEPSSESICSGQNLPTYYIKISYPISFYEIEAYLGMLRQNGIDAQAILDTNTLVFKTPLMQLLDILTTENSIKKSLMPDLELARPAPLTYSNKAASKPTKLEENSPTPQLRLYCRGMKF